MSATYGPEPTILPSLPHPPGVVLDTNVALDMLAFRDARAAPLATAIEDGEMRWLASAYMRDELHTVVRRPGFARYDFDVSEILARFDRLSQLQPEPASTPMLRCRDAADQAFLDLALAGRARWLVTHDRDLLSLARHALRHALSILTPMAWAGQTANPRRPSQCRAPPVPMPSSPCSRPAGDPTAARCG